MSTETVKFCKRGHSLVGPNLRIRPSGGRECKACHRQAWNEYRSRRVASGTWNNKPTPEQKKKADEKWKKNNQPARKAHLKVSAALETGKLKKGPCEKCGSKKVHGHHENYAKPLNVMWLCQKHHTQLHREKRNNLLRAEGVKP